MPLSIPHPNPLPQGGVTKNLPQKALLLEGEGIASGPASQNGDESTVMPSNVALGRRLLWQSYVVGYDPA
jgi:hypothetical protein